MLFRSELLHVNDMAEACVFVMQNLSFKDCITHHNEICPNEIRNTHLNVGYGSDVSIAELANLIKEIVGFEGELVFDTSKPDGTYQKLMDSSKLNALGWKPKIPLREGIQSVYQHYLSKN